MSKKDSTTPPVEPTVDSTTPASRVRARVLVDCAYGRVDQVVELDAAEAAQAAGLVDPHPDAVAYAESLAAPADDANPPA